MKKIKKLSEGYCIDIEDQLSDMLSQQIANSIDAEILKSLGILSTPERRKKSLSKIYKKN
jgi:hypothetical protein